jgi:solute carrier family 7 (L-type amino acid transporter), member 9/15
MASGIIYWAVWRVVLPKIFGYELVPNKVVLDDGTVVNVVRSLSVIIPFGCLADLFLKF